MRWEVTGMERDGQTPEEQARRAATIKWMQEIRDGADHWVVLSWNPRLLTHDYDSSDGSTLLRIVLRVCSMLLQGMVRRSPGLPEQNIRWLLRLANDIRWVSLQIDGTEYDEACAEELAGLRRREAAPRPRAPEAPEVPEIVPLFRTTGAQP